MLPVDSGCIFQLGMGTYTEESPVPWRRSDTDGREAAWYLDRSTSVCLVNNTVLLEIVNAKPPAAKEGFYLSIYLKLQALLAQFCLIIL